MHRYSPPAKENWQGRTDESPCQRLHQTIKLVDLEKDSLPQLIGNGFAFVGFCSEIGVRRNHGRLGAAEGPKALRQSLAKLPMLCNEITILDVGDITCPDDDLEKSQFSLAVIIAQLLKRGIKPILLGGGHETAWAHYQGFKLAQKHKNLLSVNFDAHYDLRPLIEGKHGSSGTSFLQIAEDRKKEGLPFNYVCAGIQDTGNTQELFHTAKELKVRTISAETIYKSATQDISNLLNNYIEDKDIHLSICLDVFASAYAPGVSAPQPLGLTPWQVIPLLQELVLHKNILSIEIAELSPAHDFDGITSKLAANLIHYLLKT